MYRVWFGKAREDIKSKQREGEVGCLVSDLLMDNVTIQEMLNVMTPYD